MSEIDLSQPVKWNGPEEKDFSGMIIDPDPRIQSRQIEEAPILTFYKLVSIMLLQAIPLENGETTRKMLKLMDSLEECWNADKKWKPSEDEIGKLEELLEKITDEKLKTGKTKGFVYKTLEQYRKKITK